MSPLLASVASTRRVQPDWFAQYRDPGQLFQEGMRRGFRNAAALSQPMARSNDKIRPMFDQSCWERSAAQDRIHRRFTEYIRGVATERNPSEGGPVPLPSGSSNVWVSRSGEDILADEENFHPNAGSNIEWQPVQRMH